MKEKIVFLDYSVFPVSNDIILETISLAISNGIKIICLDLGQYFPWSVDCIIRSDFSYSDKLVDRINSVCSHNKIILIPVLSVMTGSDYILNDNKYSSLKEYGYKHQGLNISSCGINKLIEELIEDLFSLFTKSEYLFLELPAITSKNKDSFENIDSFVERLIHFMKHLNKRIIYGDNMNLKNTIPKLETNSIVEYYNKPLERIEVFNGKTLSLFFQIYQIKIENIEYSLYKLDRCCIFSDFFDFVLFSINRSKNSTNKYSTNLKIADDFLTSLAKVWNIIRESREFISFMDRSSNIKYRIQFIRKIEDLKDEFILLKKYSKLINNVLVKKYQSGFFELWLNSRIDPLYLQLINLNIKARHIKEGS